MGTGNPAAPFTTAVFAASCLLGAGVVASCEVRATRSSECLVSYGTAAAMVVAGAAPKAANDVGYKTQNPDLDGVRKAQLLEELQAKTEGPPVDLPPEPDWLSMDLQLEDAVAAFDEPLEVKPVWVDDTLVEPGTEELLRDSFREAIAAGEVEPTPPEDEPLAVRMARAAAKLQRQEKA